MRRFAYLMASGVWSATEAARQAGYSDIGGDSSAIRVRAHDLAHDPKVQDAIEECTRSNLRELAALAVRRAKDVLNNPGHPQHGRMIETVLDRTGHFAKTEHTMRVEHSVDVRELEDLAKRLASEAGIDPARLIGVNSGKLIEGKAEEVEDEGLSFGGLRASEPEKDQGHGVPDEAA